MARATKLATMVVMFILIALIASFMPIVHVRATTYADSSGRVLDNDAIAYVKNMTRLPPGMPSLDEYREFAKRFYVGQCYTYKEVFRGAYTSVYEKVPVDIDMVVLLIYPNEVTYGRVGYNLNFALVYDPMTRKLLWAYLNNSEAWGYFMFGRYNILAYELSKNFPPAGFSLWYVKVDESAWRNGSLVFSYWLWRYNKTHLANPTYVLPGDYIYCPIPQNFTWEMLFEPSTVTATVTLPVTVTETSTSTTTLPPVTITSTVTATSTTTIERTVATPTTIEKTVTRVETLTVERTATATMSYTITMPVPTTVVETATTTAVETTTQVVKELDTLSLVIATGLAVVLGIAIGLMVRRR